MKCICMNLHANVFSVIRTDRQTDLKDRLEAQVNMK